MQPTVLHVFVSSTWLDLQPERAAVEAALQRLRETKFVGMEYFGSRDEDTRRASLVEVDRSQVYVGIFGGRYGSGITEAEYRRARALGLPCFIYLKDETAIPPEGRDTDLEKATLLSALKAELRQHHTVTTFTTPDDLAAKVTADLHRWLFDEYLRPPAGVPFHAPAVPRYFVPRPEVSQALMDYLTADAPTGALVVSAVHGLGGIGKTTLVAALAHNPDVQARFPDGVLWATLGQQPDVLSLLAGWIQALGDYDFRPTVVESASAHLRTLLHDKAALLVVDDAWQADHARPFLVGGPRCRLVLTTRNAALARKVGARLYDLDVMTGAQALALFQARLGPLDGDREQAAALARELGYLPLALELAAAQVEAGLSWTELLDAFRQALADLTALDLDEATYRNESLRLSFRLSLEQLSPDDQDAFAWLGVLPEDVRLNPAMAATVWDQPEASTRKRLRRLRDRALLKQVGDDRYTLHDLLHHEAKLRLVERMPLPEAQAVLLERYQARTRDGLWYTLADDDYIHAHLAWHIEQAEQEDELHALLREETAEGRNAWYEARDRLGQTAGYLEDVVRAWQLAEKEFAIRNSQFAIGLQYRYALIAASLNSLAKNIPPALLASLVEKGMWTPVQGLAYARQAPDPEQRAEALGGLVSHLPEPLRGKALREALATAQAIQQGDHRARALTGLAPHLPEAERMQALQEALAAARAIETAEDQAQALIELIPYLPEQERTRALQGALDARRAISWKQRRLKSLIELIPYLAEQERTQALQEALAAAQTLWNKRDRAEVLAGLAPHLPEPLKGKALQEALATARVIEWEYYQVEALTGLAPHLPESERMQALQEALAAARAIENEWRRVESLTTLAPHLPESERMQALQEALAAARAIENGWRRAEVLNKLASHLPESERIQALQEALDATRAIRDEGDRAKTLTKLALHLPKTERIQALQAALKTARAIENAKDQAKALIDLALYLPEPERAQALQRALAATWAIRRESDRAEGLTALAPHLPEPLLGQALEAARAIGNEHARVEVLAELALRLADLGRLQEALEAVWGIESEDARVEVLAELALRLADLGHPQEALEAAGRLWWEGARATALAALAPRLAELGYPKEALEAMWEIESEDARVEVLAELAELAPYPSESLLWGALGAAWEIGDKGSRAEVLAGLAPRLGELGYPEEALEAAREIGDEGSRAEVLAGLAPRLAELGYYQEALAAAWEIQSDWRRAEVLAGLAPHLPESEHMRALQEALEAAREIVWEWARAEALSVLAPHLPEAERAEALGEALEAARAIGDKRRRAEALVGLASHLPEAERPEALREALAAAREIESDWRRAEVLAGLAPRLAELGYHQEALAATREIRRAGDRAKALVGLASHLPQAERAGALTEALAVAWAIESERWRAEVLARLAPRLAELGHPEEALAAAREIRDEDDRAKALARLAPRLAELGHLEEALAAAREIGDADDRAKASAELIPHLAELGYPEEALVAAREIGDADDRVKALAVLAPHVTQLPRRHLYPLWQETLPILAARTRKDLLAGLCTLEPVMAALGGAQAVAETFRAIQDVGRWWP